MDAKELVLQMLSTPALLETMDLTLGVEGGKKHILAVFSVDGASLHSDKQGVFGFLRILNQLEFKDSPLMQAPVLLAQCKESREFYSKTLVDLLKGLVELQKDGVEVTCQDKDCEDIGVGHLHRIPFSFKIVCDLKTLLTLMNKQGGSCTHGCLFCDECTNRPCGLDKPASTLITYAKALEMSRAWFMEYEKYLETHPLATLDDFEHSKEGKTWSRDNGSFAGLFSLGEIGVTLSQLQLDLLHLMLRLLPVRSYFSQRRVLIVANMTPLFPPCYLD